MEIPKVIDIVVKNDLCIGCGICIQVCPSKALGIKWNEYGFLIPEEVGPCDSDGACISVCPFNPTPKKEVQTENELAELFLNDTSESDPQIGKYNGLYAGYSPEFRQNSSSGGIATYVFSELLERGIVNHILSVKESDNPDFQYDYAVSSSKEDLLKASKTRYYPVSLATALSKIDELEGTVALVGVACFIKGIRLAQINTPSLKGKITFLVGIICGGVKSRFFAEYLAEKAGVPYNQYIKPQFRIKDVDSSASDYSFGCKNVNNLSDYELKMRTVGDMWGTGMFKANACDFCDDVTTELADISVGDAWLAPYIEDGRGTNVVVTRSILADNIINEGIQSGKLKIDILTRDRFLASQKGSFNHRHTGLRIRINEAKKKKQLVPPKRFEREKISFDFAIVQKIRMKTRKMSLKIWNNSPNAILFDEKMRKHLLILNKATLLYRYKKAIMDRLKKK
ncbi:MAG: 4Fe-4S ferredoxin [Bacteroidetes bacterium]|nr:MAG: 4Fe-4S ferredoxin [Bacteroidota bacterium]